MIRLNPAEEAWRKNHQTVRVSIPAVFPPLMFLDEDGSIEGIIPDYLNIVSQRSGLHFDLCYAELSELPGQIANRQTGMFPVFMNLEPNRFMDMSGPCLSLNWIIVNRLDAPFFRNVADLKGMNVSIVKHSPLYQRIIADYPEIRIFPAENPADAIQSVAEGKTDAFVTSLPVAGYLIHKHRLANLKIAGSAGYEDFPVRFAVRRDYPELTDILNKAIGSVSRQEHDEIFHKWMPLRYEHAVAWESVRNWILGTAGICGIILSISLLWNRQLLKEISKRRKAEDLLKIEEARFRTAQDMSLEAFTILESVRDAEGKITDFVWTYANPAAGRILKHPPEKLLGQGLLEVLPGNAENQVMFERYVRIAETGLGDEVELKYQSEGIEGWFRNMTVKLGDGIAISFSDITPRKQAENILRQSKEQLELMVAEQTAALRTTNERLVEEIKAHKQAEEALRESENLIRTVSNNLPSGMIYQIIRKNDGSRKFTYISDSVHKFYGCTPQEAMADANLIYSRVHADDRLRIWQEEEEANRALSVLKTEVRMINPLGEIRWSSFRSKPRRLEHGSTCWDGIEFDITERKRSEDRLLASLNEKEVLLREVHHRVKNNLELIISLIEMQCSCIPNESYIRFFHEIKERIWAIAHVHEDLYHSDDLSHISFRDYLEDLTCDIRVLYDLPDVELHTDFCDAFLNIETAIPCGLIYIELLTNALKHAFLKGYVPENKQGACHIIQAGLRENRDVFTLTVSDNGVGMPPDFDWREAKSMGLRLVNILTKQIDGHVQTNTCKGTAFSITFPKTK